jgi:hypothetical protein
VVARRRLPSPAASWVYELTDLGLALKPVLLALAQWGRLSPLRDAHLSTTPAAIALALLAHFNPSGADGLEIQVDLDLDGDMFRVQVSEQTLRIGPPSTTPGQACVRVAADNLKAVVGAAGQSLDALRAAGATVDGDTAAVAALLGTLTLRASDALALADASTPVGRTA